MNRFFKIFDAYGSVLDILIADNKERAEVLSLFRPWHNVFLKFSVVECGRQEWINRHWPSCNQADS